MIALIAWLTAHWSEVTATAGALWTIISIINGAIKAPEAKTWIGKILDGLSYIKRAEAPGSVKTPFKLSKRSAAKAAALLPILFLLAGCSCFKPETRNTPGCAILHNIIDCTADAVVGGLSQSAQAIVAQFIAGNASVDWGGLEGALEQAGIKDGGCILAQLENQFLSKAKAGGDFGRAGQVSQSFLNFKRKLNVPPDVRYCFTPKGSTAKVCR